MNIPQIIEGSGVQGLRVRLGLWGFRCLAVWGGGRSSAVASASAWLILSAQLQPPQAVEVQVASASQSNLKKLSRRVSNNNGSHALVLVCAMPLSGLERLRLLTHIKQPSSHKL